MVLKHLHSSSLEMKFQNKPDLDAANDVILWMDGETAGQSEAACARLKDDRSKCTTRILESEAEPMVATDSNDHYRLNILLLLLDPISRLHFLRVMTRTRETLQELSFVHFENYTAVGPNSGPNQAALYSGIPLERRDGIASDIDGELWLWDRLRQSGYITLKGEACCI